MKPNVIEMIVQTERCIGCGVCAAICPAKILSMAFNEQGNYQPFESPGCLDGCSICLALCPFVEGNADKEKIGADLFGGGDVNYLEDLGYFRETMVAYNTDDAERIKSASGGAGYSLLQSLLVSGDVDAILAPVPNNNPAKLFQYEVLTGDDLQQARGSVYYPLELSGVLRHVMENEGKYAITALPCVAKAIRLAQQRVPLLQARILYVIGLVCGQVKTKRFTEELGRIALGHGELAAVRYRVKQQEEPAGNYAFEFTSTDGRSERLSFRGKPRHFWANRLFTPMACNVCDDVFAEVADVALMDAWLPEYSKDYRGHTLMIVRSKSLKYLIAADNSMHLQRISGQRLWASQKAVVQTKKALLGKNTSFYARVIINKKTELQRLSNVDYFGNRQIIEKFSLKLHKLECVARFFNITRQFFLHLKTKIKKSSI